MCGGMLKLSLALYSKEIQLLDILGMYGFQKRGVGGKVHQDEYLLLYYNFKPKLQRIYLEMLSQS